jgi:hypothetical protein
MNSRFEPQAGPARLDLVRWKLATSLLTLTTLTLVAIFVLIFSHTVVMNDLTTLTTAILTPVISLTGAAVGFYFGTSSSSKGDNAEEVNLPE